MGYVIDYKLAENFVNIEVEEKLNFKLAEKYSVEALKLAYQNRFEDYVNIFAFGK